MRTTCGAILVVMVMVVVCSPAVNADVFDMPVGTTSLEMVFVGDIGSYGVAYGYHIGTYEITCAQYVEFLNAAAIYGDVHGLYDLRMVSDEQGCQIQRTGDGTVDVPYEYSIASDRRNHPVNYISWMDAARFCNWLTNGQLDGDTETGSYNLVGSVYTRSEDARYVIPTGSEWKKAAYYNVAADNLYNYPTGTYTNGNYGPPSADNGDTMNIMDENSTVYAVGAPYWTTPVGAYALSDSPYGTYDQGGNVKEIVENGDKLGGAFDTPLRTSKYNYWTTGSAGSNYGEVDYGFRIVEVHHCGHHGYLSADLNQDCYVEWADFGIFADQWQQCTDPNPPCSYWPE